MPNLAMVAVSAPDIALDLGERSLWAHALTRSDAWVLCGPDKASLRFGVRLGFRERLVALEWLLDGSRVSPETRSEAGVHKEMAGKDARRALHCRATGGVMTTSVDIRAQIVNVFRRDLIGPGAAGCRSGN